MEQFGVAGFGIALHQQVHGAGMGKFGCRPKAAMLGVKHLHRRPDHAIDQLSLERPRLPGEALRLVDGGHHALRRLQHLALPLPEGLRQGRQHPAEARHAANLLRRKVRPRVKRLPFRR